MTTFVCHRQWIFKTTFYYGNQIHLSQVSWKYLWNFWIIGYIKDFALWKPSYHYCFTFLKQMSKNKSTACSTNTRLPGSIILFKNLRIKRGITPNISFRVMPLVLQLHLVMMSNYSKFGVDTFNTIWVMGNIKVFAWRLRQWRWWSSNHKSLTFSLKKMSKKMLNSVND